MTPPNQDDLLIDPKKSWVTIESVVLLVIMAFTFAGTWATMLFQMGAASDRIEVLQNQMTENTAGFAEYINESHKNSERLESKLGEILIKMETESALKKASRPDPWTGRMMEASDRAWMIKLIEAGVPLKNEDRPDVMQIQRKYIDAL